MNTDFKRIIDYYSKFNEWERFEKPQGILEFEIVKQILLNKLSSERNILDLGGGPGRYTFLLAEHGFQVSLADISPQLIEQAQKNKSQCNENVQKNIREILVLNALDLSYYQKDFFDAVLLFGPLYHLNNEEIIRCLKGIKHILKHNGYIFIIYMPYEVGLKAILERSFYAPEQVNNKVLNELVKTGYFKNNTNEGFQEGFFIETIKLVQIMKKEKYDIEELRSIRGIGFGNEEEILERKKMISNIIISL